MKAREKVAPAPFTVQRTAPGPLGKTRPQTGKLPDGDAVRSLLETAEGRTPVQREHVDPGYGDVVAAARIGISGPGGALPHLDRIQRSFGRHDVSGVVAHTDGKASMGARAMGAAAFTMGNHVSFAGSASLRTAAHEAAHAVQQRGNLQLAGGIGQVGDSHEQHADAVAERVEAGRSSEDLLDRYARPAAAEVDAASGAVQRKCAACAGGDEPCATCASSDEHGLGASDLHGRGGEPRVMPQPYVQRQAEPLLIQKFDPLGAIGSLAKGAWNLAGDAVETGINVAGDAVSTGYHVAGDVVTGDFSGAAHDLESGAKSALGHVVSGAEAASTDAATAGAGATNALLGDLGVHASVSGTGLEVTADLLGTPSSGGARLVQRFGSLEHQGVANQGSGGQHFAKADLGLAEGDLMMLRGDYFEEDVLLAFWNKPGSYGQLVGTQDEIIYAIRDATKGKDPRFAKGGVWSTWSFSPHVVDAVERRYYRLANKNYDHYVDPGRGKDKQGMGIGGAAATYREAHERAIIAAHEAGAAGKSIDDAMVVEAMGQHFLTDAFAAGHVSTRRGQIEDILDTRYPAFRHQIITRIITDMTDVLIENGEEFGHYLPRNDVKAKVTGIVRDKLGKKSDLTLGKFIGLVGHDYDNDNGLWFVNKIGMRWFGKGDGHMDDGPMGPFENGHKPMSHRDVIVAAVKAGVDDVRHAYSIGKSGHPVDSLFYKVRDLSAAPAFPSELYAPEMYMPQLDLDRNGEQNITEQPLENLFETRIRADRPSWGKLIDKSARSGTIADQLKDIAADLDPEQDALFWGLGMLHPQEAFERAVMSPVRYSATTYLLYVLATRGPWRG